MRHLGPQRSELQFQGMTQFAGQAVLLVDDEAPVWEAFAMLLGFRGRNLTPRCAACSPNIIRRGHAFGARVGVPFLPG